jgi:hypothetical protein
MRKGNVVQVNKQETFIDDPLTGILRQGARDLLAQALEMEIETVLNQYKDLKDQEGHQRVVRNGYLPERQIQTGIGPVSVASPRIRDRSSQQSERITYRSEILPPYLRKTRSMEQLIPWLYLTNGTRQ